MTPIDEKRDEDGSEPAKMLPAEGSGETTGHSGGSGGQGEHTTVEEPFEFGARKWVVSCHSHHHEPFEMEFENPDDTALVMNDHNQFECPDQAASTYIRPGG